MRGMNAKLRAKFKAWDREERQAATAEMVRATEAGDVGKARQLLSRFPLLDHWVVYDATCWSQLAAAAGQAKLMEFWRRREQTTRPPRSRASPESLLFWAMGSEYVKPTQGDPAAVAAHLLKQGANIEGDAKGYSPLHRAVFMNRPPLVELLIRRGANLARPYLTGASALQIARENQISKQCAALLERAGAPLELPRRPERPKPVRTVDLRESAAKLNARVEKAVRSFARRHPKETVTTVALASAPHEGYVIVSFDTGEFGRSAWDCTHAEFAQVSFPDWERAHDADAMRLVDLDGRTREKEPDAFQPQFKKMIIGVLQSLEREGAFAGLNTAKRCEIGVELTLAGEAKFWRLRG